MKILLLKWNLGWSLQGDTCWSFFFSLMMNLILSAFSRKATTAASTYVELNLITFQNTPYLMVDFNSIFVFLRCLFPALETWSSFIWIFEFCVKQQETNIFLIRTTESLWLSINYTSLVQYCIKLKRRTIILCGWYNAVKKTIA